jgi:hypothetical protein
LGFLRAIYVVYFMAIGFLLSSFGTYFPILVCYTKINLATLEPILRLLNLQLQRQRRSRLERFLK